MNLKILKIKINALILKRIDIILCVITLIILYFLFLNYEEKKRQLKQNYYYTIGYILKWESYVEGWCVYKYYVDTTKYVKSIQPSFRLKKRDKYYQEIEPKNKMFWVIYSPDDHSFSLINLREEILDTANAKFPNSLKHFE